MFQYMVCAATFQGRAFAASEDQAGDDMRETKDCPQEQISPVQAFSMVEMGREFGIRVAETRAR